MRGNGLHVATKRLAKPEYVEASEPFSSAGRMPRGLALRLPCACPLSKVCHYWRMAFRIHDSVVRGEIDNRVKGIVRGRIWVEGRAEPVVLELMGNAWPDLAGCLLTFTNPLKRIPHGDLDGLDPLQRGSIGDLTASRKVRVFDIPLEDALAMYRRKEKPPEHMANCLYLEWFSEANGTGGGRERGL